MSKTNKYQCDICNKQFIQKSDLDKHKNKKNACIPLSKLNEITEENKKLKQELDVKQKHDIMKNNLTNLFKWSLDLLRDQEHLVGDKALRSIAYFLILRLSEVQIENGTIDIDNMDYYKLELYEEADIRRYMTYARFSILNKEVENNMTQRIKNLISCILSYHPKFKDLFSSEDVFRIEHDSTFKKMITRYAEFPFEDYEADIQGEAYEEVIKDIMIGKTLGQFFTPPAMKKFMVELIDPQVKQDGTVETIFDPAMGTGGFLITSLRYYIKQAKEKGINLNWDFIRKQGVGGREAEPDTFQFAKANMLISSGYTFETLERNDSIRIPIQKKYDIILANPPFGIKGLKYNEIQNNDVIKKETYIPIVSNSAIPLFIQAIIYMLKINGRCATVIPHGQELFNKGDGLIAIREYLMKTCDLREIIMMPPDMFNNTGIKTCVFYFEKKKEGNDILEVSVKNKKQIYKFKNEYQTNQVKFYDYDPIKKEKKLLVGVDIKDITKNNYSLNYMEYINNNDTQLNEYKKGIKIYNLEEICSIQIGGTPRRDKNEYWNNGKNLWVSVRELNHNYIYDTTEKITDEGVNNSSVKLFNAGTVLFSFKLSIGKTAIVGKSLYTNEAIAGLNTLDNKILDNKYLYYFLTLHDFENLASGMLGNGSLNKSSLAKIKIPVPSLGKQKEIIKHLDFLYETIERSEKKVDDLKMINKIIMDNQIQNITNMHILGSVCTLKNGTNILSKDLQQGNIPVVGGGKNPLGYHNMYNVPENTIIFSKDGAYAGYISKYKEKIFVSNHGIYMYDIKEDIVLKDYIYYYLKLIKQDDIYKLQTGTAQPGINKEGLSKLYIPVPSLEKQKEIVEKIEQNDNLILQLQKEIETNKQLAKEIINNILQENKLEINLNNNLDEKQYDDTKLGNSFKVNKHTISEDDSNNNNNTDDEQDDVNIVNEEVKIVKQQEKQANKVKKIIVK